MTNLDSASGHACGVFKDKSAKCWGSNAFGVLGIDSDEREAKAPTAVKGFTKAKEVACGQNHCCGLQETGAVSCWGYASSGQLGNGSREQAKAPVAVTGMTDGTSVKLMENTSCALKKDGTVWCWGSNFDQAPRAVENATDIVQMDAEGFGCGVKKDKTVVCWASKNDYGQLGDGTNKARNDAAPVKGIKGAKQVAVGRRHACALLEDSTVKCWGENGRGQLGDGTIDDRNTPVKVVQVNAEKLEPQADKDKPTALADGAKAAKLDGAPSGCESSVKLAATVNGKKIPFTVVQVEGKKNHAKLGYYLTFRNYELDEKKRWAMPRGKQARIGLGLEKWVIEKNDEGKERPVQKPADKSEPYTTGFIKSYRLTNGAGIFDNHRQRFFDDGQVTVTHMDDEWVCGEVDLRHKDKKHALKGKFTAKIAPAK